MGVSIWAPCREDIRDNVKINRVCSIGACWVQGFRDLGVPWEADHDIVEFYWIRILSNYRLYPPIWVSMNHQSSWIGSFGSLRVQGLK